MEIEVKGHSGCEIKVVREERRLYVYKSSRDPKYLDRLMLQARKQQQAARRQYHHIRVPEIHAVRRSEKEAVIKMDYVYSRNFVEFFEQAGFEQVHYLTDALIAFLESEVKNSPLGQVARGIVTDKFSDVKRKTLASPRLAEDPETNKILDRSQEIFAALPDMRIPVGTCHGDLTFSNILFNGNNYYLIDFLDSFIESPLLDIVKLRQDTAWMWSQLMYTRSCDTIRLRIVMGNIDQALDTHFADAYPWYRQYYRPLQLMNFLRILQYAKEPRVIDYLKRAINEQLEAL